MKQNNKSTSTQKPTIVKAFVYKTEDQILPQAM